MGHVLRTVGELCWNGKLCDPDLGGKDRSQQMEAFNLSLSCLNPKGQALGDCDSFEAES